MEYGVEEKAWSVVWYGKNGSAINVQRECRMKYGCNAKPPDRKTIRRSWNKFLETGSVNRKQKKQERWV
uniref:DUF4817 domain-containing protein n=1 Tax=Bursaphelenchus xylophilus TaxID=6326 RepID=A0A1I7SCU9_BURXY